MSRLERHNEKVGAKYGIPPEKISEAALNPDWFVKKIERPWHKELAPGVTMTGEALELGDGDFTNVYDICVAPTSPAKVELRSFSRPKKPTHIFRDDPRIKAMGTLTFFYIIDDSDPVARAGPRDGTMNLCIRDGKIFGLPSADRPVLFEIAGMLRGEEVKAEGNIDIKGQTIRWKGGQNLMHSPKSEWSRLYDAQQAYIFNSACTAIVKENENPHGLRMLEKETYFTPECSDATALSVCLDDDGQLRVKKMQEGGKMGLFDGNFILQVPSSLVASLGIKKDDVVVPLTLGDIDLTKVHSAVTVGPSVMDYKISQPDRKIDRDRSFGQPPPFTEDKRYARTIFYKDAKGIHLRIYDAVPVSSNFRGISPLEVAEHLPDDAEWAYFGDGGQSVVQGIRDNAGKIHFFGNNHYSTQKLKALEARLDGLPSPKASSLLGRPRSLPSAFVVLYGEE
jgi:hypothetical protein